MSGMACLAGVVGGKPSSVQAEPPSLTGRIQRWHQPAWQTGKLRVTDRKPDIVLVHSSDLHVDDEPAEPSYGTDGTSGLRWVLDTAREGNANYVLLVGDTFDNNRQSAAILQRATQLLADAGRMVVILP